MTNKKKRVRKKTVARAVEIPPVPVEWYIPEHIKTYYVTDMTVQFTGHDFVVSFFELRPPVILGSISERMEQAKRLKSVRKQCITRVAVNVERMPDFIKAFQTNLKRYKDQIERKGEN